MEIIGPFSNIFILKKYLEASFDVEAQLFEHVVRNGQIERDAAIS